MKKKEKKGNTNSVNQISISEKPLFTLIISALVVFSFYLIYEKYFPTQRNTVGHDYSSFLPQLLDGYFWYHTNGIMEVPWFTPSYGGGLPNFPNPQSIYYSVPQFASFFMDPLSGVKLTLLLFGVAGFAGFFLLLSRVFKTDKATALLGATLFLFNGFFAHRMQIGHLTFHSFMLCPFLFYAILNQCFHENKLKIPNYIMENISGGLVLAYMFYAGSFHIIPPVYLTSVIIAILSIVFVNSNFRAGLFLSKIAFTILIGCALAFAKLNAISSFVSLFPRELYPLPGIDSFSNLIQLCFNCLFSVPDSDFANKITTNKVFILERHEYEFGVGVIPFILVLTGFIYFLFKRFKSKATKVSTLNKILLLILGVLLFIPLLLNYYSPGFNQFLKTIPVIKNSSTNVRWFCVYIPVLILLSGLTIKKIKWLSTNSMAVSLTGIAITLFTTAFQDMKFYKNQPYDPKITTDGFKKLKSGKITPGIKTICNQTTDTIDNLEYTISGNGMFVSGCSVLSPYEPLFGYRLENFPLKQLTEGPAMTELAGGILNMKNPSSYVFPKENDCQPGDHFKVSQKSEAEKFLNYRPFHFEMSARQHLANTVTLLTLVLCLAYSVLFVIWTMLTKIKSQHTS